MPFDLEEEEEEEEEDLLSLRLVDPFRGMVVVFGSVLDDYHSQPKRLSKGPQNIPA